MTPAVESKQIELAELCRQYRVRRLELFGSAAGSRFNSATSDLVSWWNSKVALLRSRLVATSACFSPSRTCLAEMSTWWRPPRSKIRTSFSRLPRIRCCSMRLEALKLRGEVVWGILENDLSILTGEVNTLITRGSREQEGVDPS
jgi:hypothetical protein